MKKTVLFSLTLIFFVTTAKAQFTGGISGGLPLGDAGDLATFSIAVDLGYLFDLSDEVQAGPITGFSHSFGEDLSVGNTTVKVDDVQFVPIGGGVRASITEQFGIGADLGYALGVNEGNDGGFYYAPRAHYSVSETVNLVLAYRGISENGGSWNILSFGVEFELSK